MLTPLAHSYLVKKSGASPEKAYGNLEKPLNLNRGGHDRRKKVVSIIGTGGQDE